MARRFAGIWQALVLILCVVAYQWLVHSALIGGQTAPVRLALMALPFAALAYWIATRARSKLLWSLILLGTAVTIYVVDEREHLGLAATYGIPHAAVYLMLLWIFATTLMPGRQPLVTRLARRVHGALPPEMEAYTRWVTIAWCVFFGAQVVTSGLLLRFASLNAWSLFVNVLSFPLVALMFVVEYGYRIVRYRNFAHASLEQTIRAFIDDAAQAKGVKIR
jgi:uncharacterized membrane protein